MSIADKYTTLTSEKIPSVYDAGKQAEYDRFWDIYQNNGEPMRYFYSFAYKHWNDETFKPKYNIVFNSQGGPYLFTASDITEVNVDIDTTRSSNWNQLANAAAWLKKIQKIILKDDGSQTASAPFSSANSLEYVRFEGKIGVTVSFSSCPLDLESAKDVIEHLMDYSGTDKDLTYSIKFSDTTKALIEAEGATSPNNSTWLEYAQEKGWNI